MRDKEGVAYDCQQCCRLCKNRRFLQDDATDTRLGSLYRHQTVQAFTLHADFTYDLQNYNARSAALPVTVWNTWNGNISEPSVQRNINGTWAKETNSRSNLWTVNVFGTYEHSFMDALNLKVMAGGTAERYQYSEFSATQKRSSECRPTIPWSYYRYLELRPEAGFQCS